MKITALRFAGFRGARSEVSLEFPRGFVVVVGRNGSGKSTVCDAVEFALSGKIRGSSGHTEKGEGLLDYVWWRGRGTPSSRFVELVIGDDEGQQCTVRRTPTEFSVSPSSRELVQVLCHDAAVLESPMAQLCRTAILRDEEITHLSVDLKEADRFDFVRSSLGTADFSSVEGKIKEVQGLVTSEVGRVEQSYSSIKTRVANLTANLSQARTEVARTEDVAAAEAALRQLIEKADSSTEKLAGQAECRLSEFRVRIDSLARLFARIEEWNKRQALLQTPEQQAILSELTRKAESVRLDLASAEKEATAASEELAISQSEQPRNTSLALLREHGLRLGLIDGACPLCGSRQSDEHYQNHLDLLNQTVTSADEQIAEMARKSAEASRRLAEIRAEASRLSSQVSAAQQQQAEGAAEREAVLAEAQRLNLDIGADAPDLVRLAREIESRREEALRIEKALSVVRASRALELVNTLEHDLKRARLEQAEIDVRVSRLRLVESQVKEASHIVRRVRGEYVDEQLAELEPLLLELYQRMRPHVDWQELRYRLRGDVRRMLSFEIGDGLNPSFVFSSGQRRAAGLAFLLAIHLSRSWCALKTLILDDPVQHIDDYRALHLTEVLAAIRLTGRQVICTVEDESLAKLLARRLRSDRDSGGMIVQLGYSSRQGVHVQSTVDVHPLSREVLIRA